MASDTGCSGVWTSTASCRAFCFIGTAAAKTFLTRLLSEYNVPEVIHTVQLQSYQATIRDLPSLDGVDHQQVISAAYGNNVVKQSHRPTRR